MKDLTQWLGDKEKERGEANQEEDMLVLKLKCKEQQPAFKFIRALQRWRKTTYYASKLASLEAMLV